MNVAMENNRHIESLNSENLENIEPNTKNSMQKQSDKTCVKFFFIFHLFYNLDSKKKNQRSYRL